MWVGDKQEGHKNFNRLPNWIEKAKLPKGLPFQTPSLWVGGEALSTWADPATGFPSRDPGSLLHSLFPWGKGTVLWWACEIGGMGQTFKSNLCPGAQAALEELQPLKENTSIFPRALCVELSFLIHLKPPQEAGLVPVKLHMWKLPAQSIISSTG